MKRVVYRIPLAMQVVKILEGIHQDRDQGTNRVVPSSGITPFAIWHSLYSSVRSNLPSGMVGQHATAQGFRSYNKKHSDNDRQNSIQAEIAQR
ncbi:hypothetical protein [Maritalea myrionectae]|uniref:hypothetical protein n=1 Tax=Maritalea myrionectae TaxID=454601 RepID=UPI00146C76C4|nr:hypothetical protein [Maritalea myrionectae]